MKYILNKDIEVLKNELVRGTLLSTPLKIQFMKKYNMSTIDEVENWMSQTRKEFKELVEELSK